MKVCAALLLLIAISLESTALAQVGNNADIANPNLASEASLIALPDVSEDMAEAIIANRPYLTALDLAETIAPFVDDAGREALFRHLFRPINLNTATDEEINLIPGMTPRMVHEFEEYRPYRSLDQFRREIGKYVDDEELARLEQYVFVPMNLNEASSEDFATIPGMTPRMVHEFEEYRPYRSLEQFRREIGKYVDDDEVERLASYVTLD